MQHDRVWERGPDPRRATFRPAWQPRGTYGLLIAIGVTFLLQQITVFTAPQYHNLLFTVSAAWFLHPWGLVTSTFAHDPLELRHILFNGLILLFMGPLAERIIGTKRYVWLFIISGAISGLIQVTISTGAALGASGALMMVIGTLVMVMPREKVLLMGIVPIPFWALGVFYVAFDLLGAIGPADGIGHFAHLSGMALGLWLGYDIKRRARAKPRMHVHWTAAR